MKCHDGGVTSRGKREKSLLVLPLALVLLLVGDAAAQTDGSILPPDRAARLYEAGRDAVKRGDHQTGIARLTETLETGYRQAKDRLGNSRFFVDRYDPDYWLGVAYMETGAEPAALTHLQRSLSSSTILRWPEAADLKERLATLEKRRAARETASQVRAEPVTPTPTALPAPPPTPPTVVPPSPTPSLVVPEPRSTPPPADPRRLEDALGALAAADFPRAEAALRTLRAKDPDALETDLVEALLAGTRYLLEGRKDASLLARGRTALGSYRARGGSRKAEIALLSPTLAATLN